MFNPLLGKLQAGGPTLGMWITLDSPTVSEVAVAMGLDWVVVDLEHGHLSTNDLISHVRIFRGSQTAVIVRIPLTDTATISRALDMGVHGILLPLLRNRAELDAVLNAARYPQRGQRGVGGERAVQWGLAMERYLEVADDETMMIPMIETREAVDNVEDILSAPGIRAIFFGPADLSASYGFLGQWEGPGVADTILRIKDRAAELSVASGVIGRGVTGIQERVKQGFGMVGLGSDTGFMIDSLIERKAAVGAPVDPHLWF